MGHPVNWFQISGGDGAALHKFYKTVFGWKMSPAPGPGALMLVSPDKPDGIGGGLGASPDGKAGVVVYVGVKDIDGHLTKIGAAGGKTLMPKMALPDGWGSIALFQDPAGNTTGIWEAPAKRPVAAPKKAKKEKSAPKVAKAKSAKKAAKKKPEKAEKASKKSSKKAKKGGKKK